MGKRSQDSDAYQAVLHQASLSQPVNHGHDACMLISEDGSLIA